MQSDIEVMQYITGKVSTYKESLNKLNFWIERYESKLMEWPYAIELKENGNFIGICGIIETHEVGYRLIPNYWKLGYGTEILNGLILFSKELGLNKLKALVVIENKGSLKILKKAGFIVKKKEFCKTLQQEEYIMELNL